MHNGVLIAVFAGAAFLCAALIRIYFYLPHKELKRRSVRGATTYKRLELVARHGKLAKTVLTIIMSIFAILCGINISREFDTVKSVVFIGVLGFAIRFFSQKTISSAVGIAVFLAPYWDWLFTKLRPIARLWVKTFRKRTQPVGTDIYTKEDLKEFIDIQRKAKNNRIEPADLDHVLHALQVGTQLIKDHMVPAKEIKAVNKKEPIGPILLSELHKTGHQTFPVMGNSKSEVLGILYLKDLVSHPEGGVVTDAMDPKVYYVNHEARLESVLQAYVHTGKSVFMVIDMRERVVGLITVPDVLKELAGESVVTSDFQNYDDPSIVAHR